MVMVPCLHSFHLEQQQKRKHIFVLDLIPQIITKFVARSYKVGETLKSRLPNWLRSKKSALNKQQLCRSLKISRLVSLIPLHNSIPDSPFRSKHNMWSKGIRFSHAFNSLDSVLPIRLQVHSLKIFQQPCGWMNFDSSNQKVLLTGPVSVQPNSNWRIWVPSMPHIIKQIPISTDSKNDSEIVIKLWIGMFKCKVRLKSSCRKNSKKCAFRFPIHMVKLLRHQFLPHKMMWE